MISIYISPDGTQVIKAKIRKNKRLVISHVFEMESYWYALPIFDNNPASGLIDDMFKELKQQVKVSYDDVHIVLPDSAFSLVDCFEAANPDDAKRRACESSELSDEDYYFSFPMSSRQIAPGTETVYAIRKEIIDRLLESAKRQKISLASVEPASISFFRCQGSWTLDSYVVQMFHNDAVITSFSPIGGIFKTDAPSLASEYLLTDEDEDFVKSALAVSNAYSMNDYSASVAFKSMRTDADYIVLTDKKSILDIQSVRSRLPSESPTFPSFVESNIMQDYQYLWMACLGTLMQDYTRDDALYDDLPDFLDVRSANMLPEHAQNLARNRQWQGIVRKGSAMVSALCIGLLAAETAGMIYFNSVKIPDSLQQEYSQAEKVKEAVNVEIDVIRSAKEKDGKPFEAFARLVTARPEKCGFTSVKINPLLKTKESKEKWIEVNAASNEEMSFQDFQSALNGTGYFGNVVVQKITADSTNIKTSLITIGKGE